MKKILTLVFFSVFLFDLTLFSQDRCPYQGLQQPSGPISTTVGNFTITDTEGNFYDLYETLDSGMTVFIDLFFTTCVYCQQYAPIIEQIYQNTGAGEENILMWGISRDSDDTDPIIDQYKVNYGITNPCAGPDGGGVAAHNTIIAGQNFLGWPTYCVICPDRTMFFDPVYPPTITGFNPYFEQCAAVVGLEEQQDISISRISSIYPNPAKDELFIDFILDKPSTSSVEFFDLTGSLIFRQDYVLPAGNHSLTLHLTNLSSGYYFLKFSQNGVFKEVKKVVVQ